MHSHTARLPTIDAYHLFQLAWIKPLFPGRNTQTCVLCLHYVREADTCESIHHQVFEDKIFCKDFMHWHFNVCVPAIRASKHSFNGSFMIPPVTLKIRLDKIYFGYWSLLKIHIDYGHFARELVESSKISPESDEAPHPPGCNCSKILKPTNVKSRFIFLRFRLQMLGLLRRVLPQRMKLKLWSARMERAT